MPSIIRKTYIFEFDKEFFLIPFYLQAVQIHSANGVKLLEAWRGVLKSQSQSHVMTDDQSVSISWCQVHSGTCDQMLLFCLNVAVLFLWGALSDERSGLPSVTHFHQCLVHCQRFNIIYIACYMFLVYVKYTRPQSAQAQDSRSCQNVRYNSNLDAWTVVRLAAANFKPLMFSVSGFALPSMADICIFMIFYNSCLLSA
jgi:hypothetical protein